MLTRVAQFWLTYGVAAKATMHGFAAIAGRQITEPPGAGFLGQGVRPPLDPFVVMVNSKVEGTNVQTPQLVVAMRPGRVRDFRRQGALRSSSWLSSAPRSRRASSAATPTAFQASLPADSARPIAPRWQPAQPDEADEEDA